MTILVTDLGPNSAALNYATKTTRFEILDGISTWLQSHGWTMHDDFANQEADTDIYKVFKATQADATYSDGTVGSVVVSQGTTTFAEVPTITFSAPPDGGTPATGIAVLDGSGYLTSITVTDPGSGYVNAPTVIVSEPFDGAFNVQLSQTANEKFVRLVVSDSRIWTEVYEAWDEVAHTGTNMAHLSDDASLAQQLTLNYGGYVYMFASDRWMVFQSRTNDNDLGSSTHGGFSGCLEISRDNPDEVVGQSPLFAFESAYQIDGWAANVSSYRDRLYCCGLPRDPFDQVGEEGARYTFISTLFGLTHNYDHRLLNFIPTAADPIGTKEEYFVLSLFTGHSGGGNEDYRHIRGRFYGVKMLTRYIGAFMDKISIPVDADSMYDPSGTPTDHYILTDDQGARFAVPA